MSTEEDAKQIMAENPKPAMAQNVPVHLDPVNAAVSKEWETQHIVGDDDGEHLMTALADASAKTTAGKAKRPPPATHTLADVPFKFLRVVVDEHGHIRPPGEGRDGHTIRRRGRLAKYFTNQNDKALWHHALHPADYQEGFPVSVDNFDCEYLMHHLEDANDLLDLDLTRWVLWVGLQQASTPSSEGKAPVFASRRRILVVKDLLEVLNEVRLGLKQPEKEAEINLVIYFIVAVSYGSRYRSSNVLDALPIGGDVMRTTSVSSPLTFLKNLINPAQQRRSSVSSYAESYAENNSSIGDYDSEADINNISNNIGDGEDIAASNRDDDSDGGIVIGGMPFKWIIGKDSRGEIRYWAVSNNEEHQRELDEAYAQLEREAAPAPRWPFFPTDEPFESTLPNGNPQERPEDFGRDSNDKSKEAETESTSPETSLEPPTASLSTPSILETLDTNAAKGDAVEGDLHALLPEAQSPEEEAWRQCCKLLCLNPEEHKDAQARSVKVPGTDNMRVKPSQLWTAYWMLTSRMDRGLCGGVLADVMGTGKTYVCLVVCLLRAYIGYNRAEVEREWQLRDHEAKKSAGSGNIAPKQHLPRDSGDKNSNAPCPCGNAMGIECYANPGGITRRLADGLSRGASLILAPQTVLDNWVKTVKDVRLQHKYYEPVVFHSKMTKEDTVMAPAPRLKQKLQMEVRPQAHVSKDGLFPESWEPNALDVAHDFKPSVAKDAFPERFIFLATHIPEKLTEFFQLPIPLRRKAGTGSRERKTVYGCPVGIQIVDEFHKAKDDVVALAHQHKHMQRYGGVGDNFDFWAITGTPLPAKLTDLETVTDIVQRLPEWNDPSNRHHGGRVIDLRELQVAYEKAVAEDGTAEQAAEFRTRAERFFQGGLVKRHTEASMFFGQRIFNLQDVAAKVVVHTTPEPLREDVSKVVARVAVKVREHMADGPSAAPTDNNWGQVVRSSSLFNHMMDLEILATFPGAAQLMLADPPVLDFGLAAIRAEIRKAKDCDVTKVELFQKHLDTVIESSPHLEAIFATLDDMGRDKQQRRIQPTPVAADTAAKSALPKKKIDAEMKKLVVLCPRMGEAVFVYLALRKLRPDTNAVFLHADLKLSERTALLQDFNRLDAATPAGTSCTARVLVGTFRDAGTGNDLTVANYQILTGPLRLRSQQDQAFGRTNREGQTLRLHHRLLVTEDSPVDRIVMATQARRQIASDPFDMDEELELAEVKEGESEQQD